MIKSNLSEMVKIAKKTAFKIPVDVTCEKTLLSDGLWAYVFRHRQLGQLGRLVFLPHNGETQLNFEVSGEPDDPMTEKRLEILEPIAKDILDKMEMTCGKGTGTPGAYTLQKNTQVVKSQIMPCNQCGAPTAMMIIALDAKTEDCLKDYARIMFSKVKETNVPTWVVGTEREVLIDGKLAGEALVLKMWPKQESARIIYSTELNSIFDELMENHCSVNRKAQVH